jgi:hypothetical protein
MVCDMHFKKSIWLETWDLDTFRNILKLYSMCTSAHIIKLLYLAFTDYN